MNKFLTIVAQGALITQKKGENNVVGKAAIWAA
jgi:hypothetical protein